MYRAVISILLIAHLLGCPLRCMACVAETGRGDGETHTGCRCCQQKQETPQSDAPTDRSGNECACPNCICEGATIEAGPEVPQFPTQATRADDLAAAMGRDSAVAAGTNSGLIIRPSNSRGSGRDALIAMQHWLI